MFSGIIFILSFFNYESPRYLVKRGQVEHAFKNLARVRGLPQDHPYVMKEIGDIQRQLAEEQEATMGQGWVGVLREMFLMPNNLYRLYLGITCQLLSQWSGAGSITVYAQDFFALLGTTGENEKLFATAIFGGKSDLISLKPFVTISSRSKLTWVGSRQIRRRNSLRFLFSRYHWKKTFSQYWHLPANDQHDICKSTN